MSTDQPKTVVERFDNHKGSLISKGRERFTVSYVFKAENIRRDGFKYQLFEDKGLMQNRLLLAQVKD